MPVRDWKCTVVYEMISVDYYVTLILTGEKEPTPMDVLACHQDQVLLNDETFLRTDGEYKRRMGTDESTANVVPRLINSNRVLTIRVGTIAAIPSE